MTAQTVSLEAAEWQQLMAILATAQGPGITWATVNPPLMRLGDAARTLRVPTIPAIRRIRDGRSTHPRGTAKSRVSFPQS